MNFRFQLAWGGGAWRAVRRTGRSVDGLVPQRPFVFVRAGKWRIGRSVVRGGGGVVQRHRGKIVPHCSKGLLGGRALRHSRY